MYEVFEQLLQKFGVTTADVCKATGIGQSTMSNWKSRRNLISGKNAQLIADYFNVSVDYLMTGKEKEGGETYYLNDETAKIAQEIFENKELKMLFDATKNSTPQRLMAYYNMIKELERQEHGEEWYYLPEINVVIMDNPFGIKGSVNENTDGSYTIIINAHLNAEQQKEVYLHEIRHIMGDDFEKYNVNEIERTVHNLETSSELCLVL